VKKTIALIICLGCILSVSAQAVTIDDAIAKSSQKIEEKIDAGTKVIVLNFISASPKLSDYVVEEIMFALVNSGKLAVIERKNLEMVKDELKFQLSGEVSDESAQSIGKFLGAKVIISGSFDDSFRFRLKAIDVATAQLLAVSSLDVMRNGKTETLLGKAAAGAGNGSQTNGQSFSYPETWSAYGDSPVSVVNMTTGMENIGGTQYMVVTANGTVSGTHGWVKVENIPDAATLNMLKIGKGFKFKVLGDGHKYDIEVETTGIRDSDYNYFMMEFTPKKGEVVEYVVPFSKLRQGEWGKQTKFAPNEIFGLAIMAKAETNKTVSLKIFDFQAY